MQTMRSSWTDERMDDLNDKVNKMHRDMRSEFRAVRAEIDARFDSLQRSMIAMMGTMVVGFASILATQL
jgi:hypothetical protein